MTGDSNRDEDHQIAAAMALSSSFRGQNEFFDRHLGYLRDNPDHGDAEY